MIWIKARDIFDLTYFYPTEITNRKKQLRQGKLVAEFKGIAVYESVKLAKSEQKGVLKKYSD